jgi:hypothetical protein
VRLSSVNGMEVVDRKGRRLMLIVQLQLLIFSLTVVLCCTLPRVPVTITRYEPGGVPPRRFLLSWLDPALPQDVMPATTIIRTRSARRSLRRKRAPTTMPKTPRFTISTPASDCDAVVGAAELIVKVLECPERTLAGLKAQLEPEGSPEQLSAISAAGPIGVVSISKLAACPAGTVCGGVGLLMMKSPAKPVPCSPISTLPPRESDWMVNVPVRSPRAVAVNAAETVQLFPGATGAPQVYPVTAKSPAAEASLTCNG